MVTVELIQVGKGHRYNCLAWLSVSVTMVTVAMVGLDGITVK